MAFTTLLTVLLSFVPALVLSQSGPPCSPGFYLASQNSECLPCPAGFFNPLRGTRTINVCSPCPENTFSTPGAAKCTGCRKGTVAPKGADRCLACPAGTAPIRCDRRGFVPLPIDVPGKCVFHSSSVGTRMAPAGSLRCVPCRARTFSKRASIECKLCPEGTESEPNSAKCTPLRTCPAGTGEGATDKCEACLNFRINDGSMSYCRSCPVGSRGNKRRGSTRCVPCPAGTRGVEFGECEKCAPGENSSVTGATFCQADRTECASNFFRNARGGCQRCTKAERYNRAKKICEPCGDNAQSNGGLDTRCKRCPRNTFIPSNSHLFFLNGDFTLQPRCECNFGFQRMPNGRCEPCPAGFKRNNAIPEDEIDGSDLQEVLCQPCPVGQFARKRASDSCSSCPAGLAALSPGQARCKRCPRRLRANTLPGSKAGSFCVDRRTGARREVMLQDEGLSKKCEGNFLNFRKFKPNVCDCVTGAESRELVNGECRFCPPGTIGRFGISGCTPCPSGTFQKDGGRLGCSFCPAGTVSKVGAKSCKPCPKGTTTFGVGEANCVKPGGLK